LQFPGAPGANTAVSQIVPAQEDGQPPVWSRGDLPDVAVVVTSASLDSKEQGNHLVGNLDVVTRVADAAVWLAELGVPRTGLFVSSDEFNTLSSDLYVLLVDVFAGESAVERYRVWSPPTSVEVVHVLSGGACEPCFRAFVLSFVRSSLSCVRAFHPACYTHVESRSPHHNAPQPMYPPTRATNATPGIPCLILCGRHTVTRHGGHSSSRIGYGAVP